MVGVAVLAVALLFGRASNRLLLLSTPHELLLSISKRRDSITPPPVRPTPTRNQSSIDRSATAALLHSSIGSGKYGRETSASAPLLVYECKRETGRTLSPCVAHTYKQPDEHGELGTNCYFYSTCCEGETLMMYRCGSDCSRSAHILVYTSSKGRTRMVQQRSFLREKSKASEGGRLGTERGRSYVCKLEQEQQPLRATSGVTQSVSYS